MSAPPPSPLPIPSRFGRYELRAVLGRGGFGVVYEAVLVGLSGFRKRVALKVLADDGADDAPETAALQREARLGAHLAHPNVVSILDLGRDQGRWYIAMELVDGAPVSVLLQAGLLDAPAVVEIGLATAAALAHIHDLRIDGAPGGLVHRDVKPPNLLVDRSGTVKLADFGISALGASPGDLSGTPAWMAPEQQRGEVSPAADLFSLGAVLYALATRRLPFGRGEEALRQAPAVESLLADPAFLAPVDAAVPGLGAVVRRCLRLRPQDRYPTAQALAADLRALRAAVGWSDLGARVATVARREPAPVSAGPTPSPSGGAREPLELLGRRRELEDLCAAVRGGARDLAIVGMGGVGKTRLAEAAAAELARSDGRATAWVELGPSVDGDRALEIARLVARALDVQLTQTDALGQLDAALAARPPLLVVLDAADGLDDALAPLSARWRAAAPDLAVLTTTRAAPRGRDARVLLLDVLAEADAVALFERRAPVPLTDADRAALPALVDALDRLPLAVELAAARTRALPVPQILQRMRDRFRLLVDPARPGTSLRSTLGASFGLLRPWEARALGELSVFAGSFALEAAEAVVELGEWPEAPWALDVLSELLAASLVRLDRAAGRFVLLHSVRDYAAGTLAPEVRRAAEVRHGEYYSQLAAGMHDTGGRSPAGQRARVEAELAELHVACERAVDRGDLGVAELTAHAAASVHGSQGPFQAGLGLLDRALSLAGGRHRARLLLLRSQLRRATGRTAEATADLDAAERSLDEGAVATRLGIRTFRTLEEPHAQAALEALHPLADEARALGEAATEARVWSMISLRYRVLEDLDGARRALDRAIVLFDSVGDRRGSALAALRLGRLFAAEGSAAEAFRCFDAAEVVFREAGDGANTATVIENRAVAHLDAGDRAAAERGFEEALRWTRLVGHRSMELNVLVNLATLALWQGRLATAAAELDQALALAHTVRSAEHEAWALAVQGDLSRVAGQDDAARLRWEAAEAAYRRCGLRVRADGVAATRWVADVERGAADPARASQVLEPLPGHVVQHLWVRLGHAALDRGDVAAAARALAAAEVERARRTWSVPFARACDVLAARLAIGSGEPARAVPLLDRADRYAVDEEHRVRAHVARVEFCLRTGAEGAAKARAALARAVERSGFAPATALARAAARLVDPRK